MSVLKYERITWKELKVRYKIVGHPVLRARRREIEVENKNKTFLVKTNTCLEKRSYYIRFPKTIRQFYIVLDEAGKQFLDCMTENPRFYDVHVDKEPSLYGIILDCFELYMFKIFQEIEFDSVLEIRTEKAYDRYLPSLAEESGLSLKEFTENSDLVSSVKSAIRDTQTETLKNLGQKSNECIWNIYKCQEVK